MERIAVLRPGALGDAVLTLPVLEAIAAAHRGAQVVAIGSPAFRLAADCGLATEWMAFDDVRLLGLFAEGGSCEAVAGAGLCVAYGRDDPLLVASLARSGVARVVMWPSQPAPGKHIVDHLLGAVEAAGCPVATRMPRLPPCRAWLDLADAFLRKHGVGEGFVAVHPGSGGRAKRWPAERFAEVAARLGKPVLWLLGPAEAEEADLRAWGEHVGVVADSIALPMLAGLLASCRVYLGNDSGVSHLAAAVGAPTVAIFGATSPGVWGPRGPRVVVAGSPQHGGLDGVAVDTVLAAIGRAGGRSSC